MKETINRLLAVEAAERQAAEEAWKRAHNQLQGLLDYASQPIFIIDADTRLLLVNKAFAALYAQPETGMAGKSAYDMLSGDQALKVEDYVQRLYATKQHFVFEIGVVINECERIYLITMYPLFTDTGEVWAAGCIATDLSELKQLQQESLRSARLASIGELAAGVAHEINNPINGVMAYAELLEDPQTNPKLAASAPQKIINECQRIADIVRKLLDYSRSTEAPPKTHDITAVLHDALDLSRSLLQFSGVNVTVKSEANLPPVRIRPHGLQQVLLNCISNARHAMAMSDRKKELTIAIEPKTQNNDSGVIIRIHDTGAGMAPEVLKRIFTPFYTTKAAGAGVGLGLSLSLQIVQEQGGTMQARSKVGAFTEMEIWLPAAVR